MQSVLIMSHRCVYICVYKCITVKKKQQQQFCNVSPIMTYWPHHCPHCHTTASGMCLYKCCPVCKPIMRVKKVLTQCVLNNYT